MSENTRSNASKILFSGLDTEMAGLISAHDWSQTLIGTPDTWPPTLRLMLNAILRTNFPMFIFWGSDLICFYNDAYRQSLGNDGKHPDLLGKKAIDGWSELWEEVVEPLTTDVMLHGKTFLFDDRLVPIYRNGKIEDVYWTFSYSQIMDEEDNVVGVIVTSMETTEKVQSRQNLQESRDELKFAIETGELGTFDFSPVSGKLSINEQTNAWFGLDIITDIDLSVATDRIHERDRERVNLAITRTFDPNNKIKYDIDYTVVNAKTGEETIVNVKGKVLFNDNNVAFRFNGILQDITIKSNYNRQLEIEIDNRTTELAHLNKVLIGKIEELKQMNEELNSFTYISSHDLQEPLRKIQTFISRINEKEYDNLSKSGKNYFDRLNDSAKRMQSLINDLLTYSKTSSSDIEFKPVDLQKVMTEVASELIEKITATHAVVQFDNLSTIQGVEFQIYQLFQNLVANALKFSRKNVAPHITISSEIVRNVLIDEQGNHDYYCLKVSDNGIGFDDSYKDRIFDIFQRLHARTEYAGTGVGLAIVKKIVDNHGGYIETVSQPGEGATFNIYLPVE